MGKSAELLDSVKHVVAPERVTLSFRRVKAKKDPGTRGLVAGVGVADITPRPGVPKGGYSSMSNFGNGFRTRLRVRSFYIHQEGAEPVVIIQTELHAGSSIIRDKVAELVAEHTNIESNNICMTCTHTHAGPGQLLDSDFYNAFASNKPGFDPELYDFVVSQIVSSVLDAYNGRKQARIATGKTKIWHATRNRSLDPHLKNPGKADETTIYDAINPYLYMVRIDQKADDGKFHPKAAISCFSIHGTSVPVSEKSYNGDVWPYISQELQWKITQQYDSPWAVVHGAFQGTHGDIAPNIKEGQAGFKESRRLGTEIAEGAWDLFESLDTELKDTVALRSAIREIDFYQEAKNNPGSIASRPVLGTALTAGAFENETPILYNAPLFKHGASSARTLFTQGEHGHKRWVGSYLQFLILPKKDYPHKRQLQTISIGDFMMLAMPFEVSVEAGKRITDEVSRVLEASNVTDKHVFVTSLANGYTGYAVTAEEYSRQYYEGGHTIYGPKTTSFLAKQFGNITEDLLIKGNFADLPENYQMPLKACHYFKANPVKTKTSVSILNHPLYQSSVEYGESCWSFNFFDRAPDELDFHLPLLRVECLDNGPDDKNKWLPLEIDGRPVDDQGYDVSLCATEVKDHANRVRYQARWYNPTTGGGNRHDAERCGENNREQNKKYRFVYMDQVNNVEVVSDAFS